MAIETLTCQNCSEDFTRERTRGRKPKHCPACKSAGNTKVTRKKQEDVFAPVVKERSVDSVTVPEGVKGVRVPWGTRFDAVEIDGVYFSKGMRVSLIGEGGTYEFSDATLRDDGASYLWLVGRSGDYEGKHRAVHPTRIDI